jgi:hypothetical protein
VTSSAWPASTGSTASSSPPAFSRAEADDGEEGPASAGPPISFAADGGVGVWGRTAAGGYESPSSAGLGSNGNVAVVGNPFAFGARDVTSAPGWTEDPWGDEEDLSSSGAARGGPTSGARRRNPWEG